MIRSFSCAIAGVSHALRSQRNMRIHCAAAALAITMGWQAAISLYEWLALVAIIAAVFVAELINTAIEAVVDLVVVEYHPLAKIAKDVAAGAVLIAAAASVVIGIMIFLPKAGQLLQ